MITTHTIKRIIIFDSYVVDAQTESIEDNSVFLRIDLIYRQQPTTQNDKLDGHLRSSCNSLLSNWTTYWTSYLEEFLISKNVQVCQALTFNSYTFII